MLNLVRVSLLCCSLFLSIGNVLSQVLNAGTPFYEEKLRRLDISGKFENDLSFLLRPLDYRKIKFIQKDSLSEISSFLYKYPGKKVFRLIPLQVYYRYNPQNLNVFGDRLMAPVAGHQLYTSVGFFVKFGILNFQLQPEFVAAENRVYEGFPSEFNDDVTMARFIYWNNGDFPERFGEKAYLKPWWGQSKIGITGNHLEFYFGTQNIIWGPGQFNNLIFSGNAPGFPHVSFNTVNPIKTFLGSFEWQILAGRLENSNEEPSQIQQHNQAYFIPFLSDWRYLNGLSITYQPKWLKGYYLGLNRTFQVNNNLLGNSYTDYFPIFETFQKEKFFENGNSVLYDQRGTDQQVSIFSRIVSRKALAEIYFEFGRRDHALNLREFILNPEHARAFLFGFQKLVKLDSKHRFLQFRGEIVHQQESVNRYIRYVGFGGNLTWHTHGAARGFTNFGQALGVGTGVGSNNQILEISIVDEESKLGISFSRLENNQDFYFRAFGQNEKRSPWIDLGMGIIWEKQWKNLTLATSNQIIKNMNHQWKSNISKFGSFPTSNNRISVNSNTHLIYRFN